MKRKLIKILALVFALAMVFSLTGCDNVTELLDFTTDTEELYSNLSNSISIPTSDAMHNELPSSFTFVAILVSDKYEMTLDDESGQATDATYVDAAISRNLNKTFIADITAVEDYNFEYGDIVSITGSIYGSVASEDENGINSNYMLFTANKIIEFIPEEVTVDTSGIFTDNTTNPASTFEFTEAYLTTMKVTGGSAILAYISFTNNGDVPVTPNLSNMSFYQGDVELGSHSLDTSLEPKADSFKLDVFGDSKTPAGKTRLYYYVLTPRYDGEASVDLPLEIIVYNDEFLSTNEDTLTVTMP